MATSGRKPATDVNVVASPATQPAPTNGAPAVAGSSGAPVVAGPSTRSVEQTLYREPYRFDFFQAVRLLEKLFPQKRPIGRGGGPGSQAARFHAHLSLGFPPTVIQRLDPPVEQGAVELTVNFMGLTGPVGVLPYSYSELLFHLEREGTPEAEALRAWFSLFDHRLVSLFYGAWTKYRFYIPYEKGDYAHIEPDTFTRALYSFVGLGMPPLRNRLRVTSESPTSRRADPTVLASVRDLALLKYSGFLAHRPRSAMSLQALLRDFFRLNVLVRQFKGQWLAIEPANQTRLGTRHANNRLGTNAVAGERVWDIQSKFRVRVGPVSWSRFTEFLPDLSPVPQRKTFLLLCQLVRLYVGLELDFDVKLVLLHDQVPECRLTEDDEIGPRLGWNVWLRSEPFTTDADDAVFEGMDTVRLA